MIFMYVTKVSNQHLWTNTMTNASDNNRPLISRSKEIVYLVSEYFLKNKEDPQTQCLERTAEATYVSWDTDSTCEVRLADCNHRPERRGSRTCLLIPSNRGSNQT